MEQAIKQAMELVKECEGFEEMVYKDSAGILTIGYGFTSAVASAKKYLTKGSITKIEAESILEEICQSLAKNIIGVTKCSFVSNELAALISFAYNAGISSYKRSILKKLIEKESRDYELIYQEFLKWNKVTINGKKKELKGLSNRRRKEADLFCQKKQKTS